MSKDSGSGSNSNSGSGGGPAQPKPESLARQLEKARFERALEISESLADRRLLLTVPELERLNNIMFGRKDDPNDPEGPWRYEPATVTLPSGKEVKFSVITEPRKAVRERLHRATELAEAGAVADAAVDIYVGLVMGHYLKDANRRTAVIAAHYFLKRYGVPLSGVALHELGLGDLREPGQIEALRETVKQMAKFATRRGR